MLQSFEGEQVSQRAISGIAYLVVIVVSFVLLSSCFILSATLTGAEVEDEIYRLVNDERQKVGLTDLERDPALDELARQYSASEFSKTVEQSSDLVYLLCNSWWETYSGRAPRLREGTAREQVDYCLENDNLRQVMLRSDARATGVGVAIMGDTVYYAQVFDVPNAVGAHGDPVRLYENAQSKDPSWDELREFVVNDDTDEQPYILDSFVCTDFATMLHDRAEAAGIRAAYVSVDFGDSPGHALNAFNTTDQGLVYIDCTGQGLNIATSGVILDSQDTTMDYDKVAYVAVGDEYGLISLDRASAFDYEFYEQWTQQWEDYDVKARIYEQKSDAYQEAVGGRTIISDPEEYARLQSMYEELETLREELEAQESILGNYRWEPMDTVTNFYVHW